MPQPLFRLPALDGDLAEAGGDHDHTAHAGARALPDGRLDRGRGHGDEGHVHGCLDGAHGREGRHAFDFPRSRIDRIQSALEAVALQIRQQRCPDRPRLARRAEDRNRSRTHESPDTGGRGHPFSPHLRGDKLLGHLRGKGEMNHTGILAAFNPEADRGEDLNHLTVFLQHDGPELADALPASDPRQVLEEQRADTLALE